jgi:hypothetical protein
VSAGNNSRANKATGIAVLAAVLSAAGSSGAAAQTSEQLERVAALEAELASLEHEIELLEASKAVKRLQRAYGYYLDNGLVDEVAALFTEDATVEIAGFGVFIGKDRVAELYSALLGDGLGDGQLNDHIITQGVVNVDAGGETAKGRWRALIQSGQHGESATWLEGPYENEYVKVGDVWRISKLHWYMTLMAPYSPGWHLEALPMPGPLADLPPDAPPSENYESYPSSYLPPFHFDNPVSGVPAGAAR